jgi:hypothetical protein
MTNDKEFTITPARTEGVLNRIIRAHEEGDGATLHTYREATCAALQELRRYRRLLAEARELCAATHHPRKDFQGGTKPDGSESSSDG